MAHKCSGSGCPYGYGHHDEHVRAAKLGWERRRHGEARYVEGSFGNKYRVHMHPGGLFARPRYILQDIEDETATFELTAHEYHQIAREVRAQERAKTEQKSLFDRANNARLRAEAAEQKKQFQAAERLRRQAERDERTRARLDEQEQRRAARFEREELRRNLLEFVPRGIAPYKERNGKRPEAEEYQAVPRFFRARSGEGLTLDDAALQLSESAPWLQIHSADDLTQAFNRIRLRTQNERARRRSA